MWKRLPQLVNKFKEIKKSKKEDNKMSDTIIKNLCYYFRVVYLYRFFDLDKFFSLKMSDRDFYSLPNEKLHKKPNRAG